MNDAKGGKSKKIGAFRFRVLEQKEVCGEPGLRVEVDLQPGCAEKKHIVWLNEGERAVFETGSGSVKIHAYRSDDPSTWSQVLTMVLIGGALGAGVYAWKKAKKKAATKKAM